MFISCVLKCIGHSTCACVQNSDSPCNLLLQPVDSQQRQVQLMLQFPRLRFTDRIFAFEVSLQLDCLHHRPLERQRLSHALRTHATNACLDGSAYGHW